MVPLMTITALSPAGHVPPRYTARIFARAADTDGRGAAGSVPELEFFPPAATYHTGLPGYAAGFPSEPVSLLPHPAVNHRGSAVIKITNDEKLRGLLRIFYKYTAEIIKKQNLMSLRGAGRANAFYDEVSNRTFELP
jgi:hypothetical protein